MTMLYLGLGLFFGLHLYSAFRSRIPGIDIKKRLGEAKYMGLYSLISVLGFVGIVWGYAQAEPSATIFNGIEYGQTLVPWLMVAAVLLLCASQLPTGFIKKTVRHPMLLAVILWSSAHLLDGADLPQVALFGSFLIYSLIDLVAVSQRAKLESSSRMSLPDWRGDLFSVLIAVAVYAALVNGLHAWLFGVSPLP